MFVDSTAVHSKLVAESFAALGQRSAFVSANKILLPPIIPLTISFETPAQFLTLIS